MRFVIVSDSHGQTKELKQVVEAFPNMDGYLHCGDSELSADHSAIQPFTTVNGNCDWTSPYEDEKILRKGIHTIFITHGHLYNVKATLLPLHYKSEEYSATIVCFGHSHLVGAEMIEGKLFLNPGSLRLPRGRKERTFMLLELDEEKASVSLMDLDDMKAPLEEWCFHIGKK